MENKGLDLLNRFILLLTEKATIIARQVKVNGVETEENYGKEIADLFREAREYLEKNTITELLSAVGYARVNDNMNWTVKCPACGEIYEYRGYYDSGDITECPCGARFVTSKVYFSDKGFIE